MVKRITGTYANTAVAGETVRAFIPYALPPRSPSLKIEGEIAQLHAEAMAALSRLAIAGAMVPSTNWFLYGFVRKEAVISSQIEGTQATLEDVLTFEATQQSERLTDIEEICNYVEALTYARAQLAKPKGLPLCTRLLCMVHQHLMHGVRGADKQPGIIRTSQNWIGGSRPGNARFVPPPPHAVPDALAALERWLYKKEALPPLVRVGLAHVQFETIHPFLDGNGRVGRLLIALLLEHWGLLSCPLLYLSLAFKKHQQDYYRHLLEVRTKGDWEGWMFFFLKCVCESANDGVDAASRLFAILGKDQKKVVEHPAATVMAIRLLQSLPEHPVITVSRVMDVLKTTKPTASKAIDALCQTDILHEVTGKRRDRIYAYRAYLSVLTENTYIPAIPFPVSSKTRQNSK
jgi:Fic family protein